MRRIAALAFLFLAALLPGLVSASAASGNAGDGVPVTSYYSVLPVDCHITSKDFSTLIWYLSADAFYFASAYPETIWVDVPLHLPQGAAVKSFSVFATDNGAGADETMSFTLQRRKLSTGTYDSMAYVSTTGLAPSADRRILTDGSITFGKVDNNVYGYYILIRFEQGSSNIKFNGAKIKYTI